MCVALRAARAQGTRSLSPTHTRKRASPHVTSPAVAEAAAAAAAAAAAPGIRLEQEPRSLLRPSSPSSVPRGRRSLDPGAAGGRGGRGGSPGGTRRATCPRPLRPGAVADSAASFGGPVAEPASSPRGASRIAARV
ncbi:hypothetical protein Celaphus_00017055 [Cervus elaphus hippelaphus]|uniref:Uncharacterized protein n=1 Tax=Cervus elaphus hippelaphus TaxID=46360 RepID=A0A212CM96_CEREH|nr:hypothetical protein Celaphus_00017055 [Cervus elaphus hippelaphus]